MCPIVSGEIVEVISKVPKTSIIWKRETLMGSHKTIHRGMGSLISCRLYLNDCKTQLYYLSQRDQAPFCRLVRDFTEKKSNALVRLKRQFRKESGIYLNGSTNSIDCHLVSLSNRKKCHGSFPFWWCTCKMKIVLISITSTYFVYIYIYFFYWCV